MNSNRAEREREREREKESEKKGSSGCESKLREDDTVCCFNYRGESEDLRRHWNVFFKPRGNKWNFFIIPLAWWNRLSCLHRHHDDKSLSEAWKLAFLTLDLRPQARECCACAKRGGFGLFICLWNLYAPLGRQGQVFIFWWDEFTYWKGFIQSLKQHSKYPNTVQAGSCSEATSERLRLQLKTHQLKMDTTVKHDYCNNKRCWLWCLCEQLLCS